MVDPVPTATVWQVEIAPADGQADRLANALASDAADLELVSELKIACRRGFLIQGDLERDEVGTIAHSLLTEPVVEVYKISKIGDSPAAAAPDGLPVLVHVLPKPGVTDAEAETALRQIQSLGHAVEAVRTFRKYWIQDVGESEIEQLSAKLLSNDAIEQVVRGPLVVSSLDFSQSYDFQLTHVPLLTASDEQMLNISRDGGLSLTLIEMKTIQDHFKEKQRDPTDIELETIAQTWSEHCSHKTLAGRVVYRDEKGQREFDNLLKETIFAATQTIRQRLDGDDWCVSVFKDNAGIVRFDDDSNLSFKVETHNRPSALEPYGGANTGIGGVLRDTLGTGMGAKPICNTDVFCFAPPETASSDLPPGVLHPRRIMKGVVAGVRDYGNRMGVPTINGAVYFDDRYVGNPIVFCGNVGLIPHAMSFKEPQAGDFIVTLGGPTGRDGIHGATFSSAELTEHSDTTSGGAVQIGNAITEKMVMDVMLQARDQGLYSAVTDCGAGGFSSAVGEMGEELGAVVWLEKAPLKYQGLSYTEIWISEAQERMVFSVPEEKWPDFEKLCSDESVVATVIGKFEATGQLKLTYEGNEVGCLDMAFMHDGRPKVLRDAVYLPPAYEGLKSPKEGFRWSFKDAALRILSSPNVASKHWVIRQYDHEVLGGSVVKPLVGCHNDGPSDASVVRPKLDSNRGIAISCGMNPYFGDFDPYHMATSSIDEAMRNCVAVGADPSRIAILDNFCWGYTDRPETLGSLVRAALACYDLAVELETPFISGKDSLNNEFSFDDADGKRQTISIPSTLLISALGQVPDTRKCVTMDFKQADNLIYQIGSTKAELGGSHFSLVQGLSGGRVPTVEPSRAKGTFAAVHQAINQGLLRSCHDLSEGGLAVAVAEMAIAGGCGADIDLSAIDVESLESIHPNVIRLFSESNTRFVIEVEPQHRSTLEACFSGLPLTYLGVVTNDSHVTVKDQAEILLSATVEELKSAWISPLDWN